MADTHEIYKTMDLALRVGELLLSSGAGAADVSAQMDNVARACGLRRFSTDVTFTELAMSHQEQLDEPALIQIRQVRRRVIDYGDLTMVDHLVRDLVSGKIDREEAAARLNRIVSTAHARPRWAVMLGLGAMSGGIALSLGGGWIGVFIAFTAACCIDVIQRFMTNRRWPVFYQQVAGGLFATLLAEAVAATDSAIGPSRVITSSIFLLLAGVSFLGAVQDALTGFPLTAGARILEAMIATAGIIAGVSGGLTFADVIGVGLGPLDPAAVAFAGMPIAITGAVIAAVAYAFASYVPYRALLPIGLISAGAMAIYLALSNEHGVGIAWASGLAALVVGVVTFSAAGRVRVPALVIVTTAIVPLLPGLSIFRALALFGEGDQHGLLAMVTAAAIAIALSAGVIFGQYLAQPLKREARLLESKLAGPRLVGPFTVRGVRRRRGRFRG